MRIFASEVKSGSVAKVRGWTDTPPTQTAATKLQILCETRKHLWNYLLLGEFSRVQEYIHSHICEEIDIDELSEVACITKTYLIRLFRKEFGTSPLQYINKKKVERAQLLLCTTDMPVKEVAYRIGFNDQSYFIRMYRKVTGTTPQEYRKQQGLS